MKYVFEVPPVYSLPIAGSAERYAVNRIFCVGRNYAAHAREMGQDEREPPFFFMKPAAATVDAGDGVVGIAYPPMTQDFHHEIELVVAIGQRVSNIGREQVEAAVYGYAVGLDMTRRDLQLDARNKGRPWEFGKSFSGSAPIGAIHRTAQIGHPKRGAISVSVNGVVKQNSDIDKMIWDVAESIAYLSRFETLEPGDLVMTGTPEGVAAVVRGDLMTGRIEGLGSIQVRVD